MLVGVKHWLIFWQRKTRVLTRFFIAGWVICPVVHDASPLNEIFFRLPSVVVVRIILPLDEVLPSSFRCTLSVYDFLNFVRQDFIWIFKNKFQLRGCIVTTKQGTCAILQDIGTTCIFTNDSIRSFISRR